MGTDRKYCSGKCVDHMKAYWSVTTEKGLGHFLTTLKTFNIQKELHHCLKALKVFNTEKGYHHCLKMFDTEKGLHRFLMTLKVLNIEKGHYHFLGTHRSFNVKKWLHHNLMTLKVYQNSNSYRMLVSSRLWRSHTVSYLWLTNFTCSECPIS